MVVEGVELLNSGGVGKLDHLVGTASVVWEDASFLFGRWEDLILYNTLSSHLFSGSQKMALLVVRQGARRAAPLMAVRGGSAVSVRRMGSAMRQPFKRSPAPAEPLHEEHELVWDDGVAPEVCLDFDAPYISKSLGLKMFLGGFLFFGSIYGFAALQPYGTRQAVRSMH